jgi:hypothetical protein
MGYLGLPTSRIMDNIESMSPCVILERVSFLAMVSMHAIALDRFSFNLTLTRPFSCTSTTSIRKYIVLVSKFILHRLVH